MLYKLTWLYQGPQTCYFRYGLSISGILQVIAHNINIFYEKMWSRDPAVKGLVRVNIA